MKYNLVALLPMKAHSQRVSGKNFKKLGHQPLFRWILDTLLSIEAIDLIVINTDARDILTENNLPLDDKILIRDRNLELQGDSVSMNLILEDDIHAIDSCTYLMTHTTNPFLSRQSILKALKLFHSDTNSDSLFTVNRFQTRFYDSEVKPINHDPTNLLPTQDLPPWFEENSCLYIFDKQSFNKTSARIGTHPLMFEIPKIESIDIDEPSDWDFAEALATSKLFKTT